MQTDVLIPGLSYCPGLLSDSEQRDILDQIDALPWLSDLSRMVQHYGYKYDYRAKRIDSSMAVGPLPEFAVHLGGLLVEDGLLPEPPDQAIINEYKPGQGIALHVDCEPCFKDTIATISLGSEYPMDLVQVLGGQSEVLRLEVGSALVLSGEARYGWRHGIKRRTSDDGVPRGRRVSITLRSVLLS
jgi:alkylated DNA repair dioxygenase AlkB